MIGVQLADVSTGCSSHPQGNNIRFLSTATATEKDVCIVKVESWYRGVISLLEPFFCFISRDLGTRMN